MEKTKKFLLQSTFKTLKTVFVSFSSKAMDGWYFYCANLCESSAIVPRSGALDNQRLCGWQSSAGQEIAMVAYVVVP